MEKVFNTILLEYLLVLNLGERGGGLFNYVKIIIFKAKGGLIFFWQNGLYS